LQSALRFLHHADRAHDLAWRAEAALESVMGDEGGLYRMKLVAARKTLNGGDLFFRDAFGSRDARPLGSSIDQDGAGTTLALSTTVLGSGQIEILAQYSQKADL
jgi:hypothetical protein